MPGTPSMRNLQETDAKMLTNATDRGPVLPTDGAKEPQGLPKVPTINTTRPTLETNAPLTHQTRIGKTETTTVTEKEPAHQQDGAKELPDD